MSQGLVIPICPKCDFENADQFRFCPKCRFPLMLVAGKYRLDKELAAGGMGQVYLASHVRLDHDTERVIKVIKPEVFSADGMDVRFRREVQVTAAISQRNDHIVRIYDDFGEEEEFGHYYVMEFLRGVSLKELLQKQKDRPLDDDVTFHIFYQLCRAIAAAHREKIVHRDLKPDNVFLIEREEDEHFVKVIDFGIARPEDSEAGTQLTQGILGTPQYMSPEQCENKSIDQRTDIYSMGMILYEMLTGQHAYGLSKAELSGSSPLGMISAHLMRDLVPLRSVRPDVSQALSDVLLKAIARAPDDRFASVELFWNAIAETEPLAHPLQIIGGKSSQRRQARTASSPAPQRTEALGSVGSRVLTDAVAEATPEANNDSRRNGLLWVFCIVGMLAFGVIVWQLMSPRQRRVSPGPRAAALKKRVVQPIPRTAPARRRLEVRGNQSSTPTIRRPTFLQRPRPVPNIRRKVARRRAVVRRRSAPKRRVTKRRRPAKRGGICGVPASSFHFVFARLTKPRKGRVKLQFSRCGKCRVSRKRGGYCLHVPSDRPTRMRISVGGYTPCSFVIKGSRTSLKWHLRLEDPDELAEENYACVR